MKTIIMLVIFSVLMITGAGAGAEEMMITTNGNDIIISKSVEVNRIRNIYEEVSQKEVPPEIAYKLAKGTLKEYILSKKSKKIISFLPVIFQTNVTYVTFNEKFLVKKIRKENSKNLVLTFFYFIVPIICFIFTQYFCVKNSNIKNDWKLVIFYASIFTSIFAGGITGDIAGVTAGKIAGVIAGMIAGDIAGGITGDIAGCITGDIAGVTAGCIAGDIAGEIGWQNADINQYIIILLIACIVSYTICNIIRMVRNKRTILKN